MKVGDLVRIIPSDRKRLLPECPNQIGIVVDCTTNPESGKLQAWIINFSSQIKVLRSQLLERA
tara:strand:+ start:300 stop:488 length:189 start_codon:yes stop_codon:yes gene_type:complete